MQSLDVQKKQTWDKKTKNTYKYNLLEMFEGVCNMILLNPKVLRFLLSSIIHQKNEGLSCGDRR